MAEKVVIVGARIDGHGKVLLNTFRIAGTYEVVGFVDDASDLPYADICGVPILGSSRILPLLAEDGVRLAIAGVGDGAARRSISKLILESKMQPVNCIHPSAIAAEGTIHGRGVFMGPNSVVVAGARVGDNVLINTAATVDHDCVVEDCVSLSPGVHLSGRVVVREGAFLGTGAVVIPDVEIGAWSIVGAGAAVIRDVPPGETVVGVPARAKESRE